MFVRHHKTVLKQHSWKSQNSEKPGMEAVLLNLKIIYCSLDSKSAMGFRTYDNK